MKGMASPTSGKYETYFIFQFTMCVHFLPSLLFWLCVFSREPSHPVHHSHIYSLTNQFIEEPEV